MNTCLDSPLGVTEWTLIADQWLDPVLEAIGPYGLDQETTRSVLEVTWLRLTQHLDVLVEDAEIGPWLIVQATREAARRSHQGEWAYLVVQRNGLDIGCQ